MRQTENAEDDRSAGDVVVYGLVWATTDVKSAYDRAVDRLKEASWRTMLSDCVMAAMNRHGYEMLQSFTKHVRYLHDNRNSDVGGVVWSVFLRALLARINVKDFDDGQFTLQAELEACALDSFKVALRVQEYDRHLDQFKELCEKLEPQPVVTRDKFEEYAKLQPVVTRDKFEEYAKLLELVSCVMVLSDYADSRGLESARLVSACIAEARKRLCSDEVARRVRKALCCRFEDATRRFQHDYAATFGAEE